jgi:ATP-dependent protease HslVU (ClpYQ) peptidase subunit
MTTVVVTRKDGLACIAADTRAAYGDTREGADMICNSDKIVRAGDAWLAPTGPASAQLVLRHHLRRLERAPRLDGIDSIFGFLTELQKALRDDYLVHGKEDVSDDFESMRMEIAVVSPGGIFGCYPQRSVQEYKRFYAFGSGAAFALGAMQVAEPHVRSAEELARIGVEAAAAFDLHSGLPLTLRTVELRGVGAQVNGGARNGHGSPAVPPGTNGQNGAHAQGAANGASAANGQNGAHEPQPSIRTNV